MVARFLLGALILVGAFGTPRPGDEPADARRAEVAIPGTALSIELVEVPLDGAHRLLFGRTEIPWEVLDVFVHGLDEKPTTPNEAVDAVTRPSKPYISMDRGFGHHGYPAISVSHRNAVEFCRWLSAKTGRQFRLPTRAEWTKACERSAVEPGDRTAHAWCAENARRKTHPVGTLKPDASGLCDMLGNAGEWVSDGDDTFVVIGGSFRDAAEQLGCEAAKANDPAWNASDPQIPRSVWWLADGGFIGFRVVCEPAPEGNGANKTKEKP